MIHALSIIVLALPCQESVLPDAHLPGRGTMDVDVHHYGLDLFLLPPSREVRAVARIRGRLRAGVKKVRLDFHDRLRITSLELDGRPADFRHEKHVLTVPLPKGLKNDGFDLVVSYAGRLPADLSQGEAVGLLSDRQVLVSYLEPDGAHHWFPCNDHPWDKARYDFRITVPAGQVAAATGELRGIQARPGLTTFHWGTDLPLATYLVSLGAGPFTFVVREGEVPILDLALPGDGERVRKNLASVPAMLAFLAKRFGPYPFERYGHVFTRLPVGGLESQTMTVLGRNAGLRGDPDLLVHEACHQWFGNWVSPERWRDLWLSEGWATYAELLWALQRGRQDRATAMLRGWRHATLVVAQRPEPDGKWTLAYPDPSALFDSSLVYSKGAMVLHLLAGYLGEEEFYSAARAYLRAHGGGAASTRDMQTAFARATGTDLEPFFDAWVRGNSVPRVRVRMQSRPDGKDAWTTSLDFEQVQDGPWHPFAADVALQGRNAASFRTSLRFDSQRTRLEVKTSFRPLAVVLDPDLTLPVVSVR